MIAEKATVYKKFPTPLVNRLEKHFVLMSSILSVQEKVILSQLDSWINQFSKVKSRLALLLTDTIITNCVMSQIVIRNYLSSVKRLVDPQ